MTSDRIQTLQLIADLTRRKADEFTARTQALEAELTVLRTQLADSAARIDAICERVKVALKQLRLGLDATAEVATGPVEEFSPSPSTNEANKETKNGQ